MVIGEAGYILNRQELIYLAAFTGKQSMLGVKDDVMLLSGTEILERWPEIKNSLYEKKYLIEDSEGTVSINSNLFNCIDVCENPNMYLSCVKSSGYFNCYFKKGVCVKLETNEYTKNIFTLTPITIFKSVKNYILDFFTPEGECAANGSKLLFTEMQYKKIKERSFESVPKLKENAAAEKALQDEKAFHSLLIFRLNNNIITRINLYEAYITENAIWRMLAEEPIKGTYALESISKDNLSADLEEHANKFKRLLESAF